MKRKEKRKNTVPSAEYNSTIHVEKRDCGNKCRKNSRMYGLRRDCGNRYKYDRLYAKRCIARKRNALIFPSLRAFSLPGRGTH